MAGGAFTTLLMKIPEEAVTFFHVNPAVPISENF